MTAPLLITRFTLYPYIHGKTLVVLFLAHIGLFVFLYFRFMGRAPVLARSPLIITLSLFLGWAMVASFFGVNFERSFWGSWPRMLGLYHLLIFFLYTWVLGSVFDATLWSRLMRYGLGVAALVSVIAILQKFFPIMVWHGYRVGSTLDNPSFLASYLIFFIFWGLLLLFKKWQWSDFCFTILSVVALVLSRTRGAIVGLLIGLIITALILLFNKENRRRGWQLLISALSGIGFILLIDHKTVERMLAASLGDTTVVSRLIIWKIAWQGFLDKPLFGWGYENFNAVFNSFYNPILLKFSISETFADKAHNLPLEFLTTLGGIGFLLYVAVFIIAIYALWRLAKDGRSSKIELAVMSGLLVAYATSLFFLFDQLFTVILFFVTIVYIHSLHQPAAKDKRLRPSLFILGGLSLAVSFWIGIVKPTVATSYNHLADSLFVTNSTVADDYFKIALRFGGPWQADIVAERASAMYAALLAEKPNSELTTVMLKESFEELLIMHKKYPHDIRFPVFIGYLGNWLDGFDKKYGETAEQVLLDTLRDLNSSRQQVGDLLTENYMVRGQYEKAALMAAQMVAVEPSAPDPHYYLGNVFLLLGREEAGFNEIKKAEIIGYPSVGIKPYQLLINQAVAKNDWPKVINLYQRAIAVPADEYFLADAVQQRRAMLFAQLAAVYSRIGNRLKAIEAVREAVRLNPTLKEEAERFIKTLH